MMGGGDDDLLADEDDLLASDIVAPKPAVECGPAAAGTKKRACKNCSCGLREMQEAEEAGGAPVKMTDEELAAQKSACGNCYKGDAFRCDSCPHRGKPAFKPGMGHLVLDNAMDT